MEMILHPTVKSISIHDELSRTATRSITTALNYIGLPDDLVYAHIGTRTGFWEYNKHKLEELFYDIKKAFKNKVAQINKCQNDLHIDFAKAVYVWNFIKSRFYQKLHPKLTFNQFFEHTCPACRNIFHTAEKTQVCCSRTCAWKARKTKKQSSVTVA